MAGSEIVGLVPRQALLMAADHYIAAEGLLIVDERQKIRLAANRLGLGTVSPFVPEKRVIEYMVADDADAPLASSSVRDFVRSVGARTSAPGGGSTSALIAALGAALGTMVGWMTYGKRKFEEKDAVMRRLIPPLHDAMEALIPLIDADTRAFADYMAAMALPKETEEQAARRAEAVQAGLKKAVEVPLTVLRVGDGCWDAMAEMARHGNIASRSDLEVGVKALEAGLWGAYRNVEINLPRDRGRGLPRLRRRRGAGHRGAGPAAPRGSARRSSRGADRARSVSARRSRGASVSSSAAYRRGARRPWTRVGAPVRPCGAVVCPCGATAWPWGAG